MSKIHVWSISRYALVSLSWAASMAISLWVANPLSCCWAVFSSSHGQIWLYIYIIFLHYLALFNFYRCIPYNLYIMIQSQISASWSVDIIFQTKQLMDTQNKKMELESAVGELEVKSVHAVTCIKRSSFSCPVIENFIWNELLLRGHLSYKTTFSLSQRWPLNTCGFYLLYITVIM
jgi:hypothetical protein